ncbi:MAG: hypothetical protein ACOY3P_24840 [Planctomycetota bacterium]
MGQVAAMHVLGSMVRTAKVQLCARLCHQLTVVGRLADDFPELRRQQAWFRALNEIQHQASGLLSRLLEEPGFSADEVLASLFFRDRSDKLLQEQLSALFERVSRSFVSQPA